MYTTPNEPRPSGRAVFPTPGVQTARRPNRFPAWLFACPLAFPAGCMTQPEPPTTQAAEAPQPISRSANKGPVKAVVTLDRQSLTLPGHFTLTLRVEAESGVEIEPPKIEPLVGPFVARKTGEHKPLVDPSHEALESTYELRCFLPGETELPPITIAFRDPREKADGSTEAYEDQFQTEPLRVTIRQELADVTAPIDMNVPGAYTLLAWLLGVAALALLLVLLARRLHGRVKPIPSAAPLPPNVWALQELGKLLALRLTEKGLVQEFYYRINALLRAYIERRFGLMAGEQTSEEFLRAVRAGSAFDDQQKQLLRRFTDACDPVKYARQQPDPDEIDWIVAAARQFIIGTASQPSAQPAEVAA
jgi:hypothetical protein